MMEARADSLPPVAQRSEYRAHIDGLRAVAVLGVVVYHATPALMPGGFAGVDVFFVISGYLISGIIFRALERGSFSYLDFYARRVKRIFPALIVMLLTVWAVSWPLLLWDEYALLGKHIVAGVGFALNLLLYQDFNLYFGVTTTPLLHLWSLGVEEQFYIVWPVLLAVLWRARSGPGRLLAIGAIALISFAANIASLHIDPTASFYLPSSRIWELALGSALAYVKLGSNDSEASPAAVAARATTLQRFAQHCQGWAGFALIASAFWILRSTFAFPGWWALMPCLGSVLLISAGSGSWINRLLLSSRPMVFIGLISYSLYLWHWPLLSLVHIVYDRDAPLTLLLIAVCAALILAVLTYRYVELPIRRSPSKRLLPAMVCSVLAACGGIGYLTALQAIPSRSESYDVGRFVQASREDWLSEGRTDWTWHTTGLLKLGTGTSEVLFIGDSNMQQYYPRIARLLRDHPTNRRGATFAVKAGCAPAVAALLDVNERVRADCSSFLRDAFGYAENPRVDTVVIAALWRGYVGNDWKTFGPSPFVPGTDAALADLRRTIAALVERGKRVYVVLNIPISPHFDPRRMIRRKLADPAFSVSVRAPARAEVEVSVGPISAKLRQVAEAAGAIVIDPMDHLCDQRHCAAVTDDFEPMYRDPGHLRPSYVRNRVDFLDAIVLDPRFPQAQATHRSSRLQPHPDARQE
jgi:peptidoglycan/LPS O-acetylase OafA/YrhL